MNTSFLNHICVCVCVYSNKVATEQQNNKSITIL